MRAIVMYLCLMCLVVSGKRPHIVLIIADDLGWNDVGFHGMNQIPTPNIDALAWSGIVLQKYYVHPVCTPSRTALMTGKYAHNLGMQHRVLYGAEPRGLPLCEKILPQYLKDLGYKTHLIGKWHLGSYKKEYLPMNRGFDSHIGFWTGRIDMYDHTNMEKGSWGFDFRRGYELAHDLFGKYVTDIYTSEAEKIIKSHNKSEPLFLVVAHSAVHSGNPPEPIRAPDDVIAHFKNITDYQRRKFAGVLSKLDESVGKVISTLQSAGLLNDSVVLFTTDNGGAPNGFNDNAGSNYPLRGTKATNWEGGTRGSAVLWSPLLKKRSRVANQRLHITDWLPTLFGIAGGNESLLKDIDGVNQWEALSNDGTSSRTKIEYNMDQMSDFAAVSIDDWKLITGTNMNGEWDNWYGPDGREGAYDKELVYNSPAGKAIADLKLMPDRKDIDQLRKSAQVDCGNVTAIACNPVSAPCLFNLAEDPCERRNLASEKPDILEKLLEELSRVNATSKYPSNVPIDPLGDPKYWGRLYTNFRDFEQMRSFNL